ncbi:MAG: hypothetical protein EPO64_12800 [Nitrospirae bacterium]|nr:MAG: hypothetical protein EPO64_12800 [Nitrospirota bacterium]
MGRALTALWIGLLVVSGCNGSKADELFETAQFEERQNNRDHARQLYEEIVKDHPNSAAARKAADRLAQITKGD